MSVHIAHNSFINTVSICLDSRLYSDIDQICPVEKNTKPILICLTALFLASRVSNVDSARLVLSEPNNSAQISTLTHQHELHITANRTLMYNGNAKFEVPDSHLVVFEIKKTAVGFREYPHRIFAWCHEEPTTHLQSQKTADLRPFTPNIWHNNHRLIVPFFAELS